MPKLISCEEVKTYIENEGYTLLSNIYVGAKYNLDVQCLCSHIFQVTWSNFKSHNSRCPKCGIEKASKSKLFTHEFVKNYVESFQYQLITNKYITSKKHLEVICPKGHSYSVSFDNFKRGKRCPLCSGNVKLSGEFVHSEFLKHGLHPEFTYEMYKNSHTTLPYKCKIHLDKGVQYINYTNLKQNKSCYYCYLESTSGQNHYNWQGGITELNHYLREKTIDWKKESLSFHNYRCDISGSISDLEVHHLYSFNKIVANILNTLQLEAKKSISDYGESLKLIEAEFINYHKNNLGVPLRSDIHKMFHSIYRFNNTYEQYLKFKEEYYLRDVI